MSRLLGILTGSAIAVAVLFVVFGAPQLDRDEAVQLPLPIEHEEALPDAALRAAVDLTPKPAAKQVDAIAKSSDTLADTAPGAAATRPGPLQPVEKDPAPAEPQTLERVTVDGATMEQQWYAFWSPFGSELAADGFVTQLQKATALDYRVVKLKPGVYEVAFAYSDDADIEQKLAQISSATGLDLSGG